MFVIISCRPKEDRLSESNDQHKVMCIRFSQDGSVIAVGQADGVIKVCIHKYFLYSVIQTEWLITQNNVSLNKMFGHELMPSSITFFSYQHLIAWWFKDRFSIYGTTLWRQVALTSHRNYEVGSGQSLIAHSTLFVAGYLTVCRPALKLSILG